MEDIIMGRRINPLSNPEESLAKKKAIEKIITEAKAMANTDVATWLPQRRYLQKTLWSLSLAEIDQWTILDTAAILAKLQGRDPRSKQIACLEELVNAEAIALVVLSHDKDWLEKAKMGITQARDIGRGLISS
jgi:hypothetical protein